MPRGPDVPFGCRGHSLKASANQLPVQKKQHSPNAKRTSQGDWVGCHRLLIAPVPLVHLLEWVERGPVRPIAVRLELLVFLVVCIPFGLARSILRGPECTGPSDTVLVHTGLSEKVFS